MLRRARGRVPIDKLVGSEVLLVIHSPATVDRLVDVRTVLHDHDDIKIRVTLEEGSRRSQFRMDGVRKRLSDLGIEPIPWRKAIRRRFDLVIATHATRGLLRLWWPNVIVMPHGAGYNRILPSKTGSRKTPVGLSRKELTRLFGLLGPKVICLSAEEQREQLARGCRHLLARVRVVGDPAYAFLRRSMVCWQSFRGWLGVGHDQRLIVITSTWTDESLYRRHKEIAARLLAQLPADRYKIVLVQHPNIAAMDSVFGIDCSLKTEKAAGLIVLPPYDGGWRAALIAADLVIGDHGSVTFYAGAIDRPVLALRTGVAELAAESPFRDYLRLTSELDPEGDLRTQIERAVADYRPGQFDEVVPHVIGVSEDGLEQLRAIIFERLGRERPTKPIRFDPVPKPAHDLPDRITSYQVRVVTRHRRGRLDEVKLERVPSAVADRAWQRSVEDVITVFEHDDVNIRDQERCEIVLNFAIKERDAAEAWTAQAQEELPGVVVATTAHRDRDRVLMRLADGRLFTAVSVSRGKGVSPEQFAYMSSALLRALVLNGDDVDSPGGIDVKVTMDPCEATIRIRPVDR